MAAIDKIYVDSYDKYIEFKTWCEKQPLFTDKYGKQEPMTNYLFTYWPKENWTCHPIASFPYFIDAYVIRNCPFDYIQEELMLRYGHYSQKQIDEAYNIVRERGGEKGNSEKDFYHWLSKDNFKVVNGVVTFPENETSTYMQIKRGEICITPYTDNKYIVGKHCRCIKHPVNFYNRPYKCKRWFVDIISPDNLPYMWYHENINTWDFLDEYVIHEWSSSTAYVKTIKALKRLIRKWKLPVGTIVRATGRYIDDTYEFIVKL